jgi:hypothetical protein
MTSWSKCRPLKRSCAGIGAVIIAVARCLPRFAAEPLETRPGASRARDP